MKNNMSNDTRSQAWGFTKQVVQGRWFTVFAAFLMMMGNGSTYIFGTYSKVVKTQFDYTQTQINTLGFAKDLGSNAGIYVGLLAEVAPLWALFFAGACFNFAGFFMLWLSITRRIAKPHFWQMFLYICLGTNSSNFSHTAILVTAVRNFPDRRGIILGLLKGFVGIGGAILTQFYLAIYGPENPSNLVLLFAWFPSTLILLCFSVIRPIKVPKHPDELKVFYHFLFVSILLALFILFLTVAQQKVNFSRVGFESGAFVIIGLLSLPLFIAIREEFFVHKLKKLNNTNSSITVSINEKKPTLEKGFQTNPSRGDDFTILQAIFSIDMALICLAMFTGSGSSLATIDNLGQIGESLKYSRKATSMLISWVSISNFFGRVLSGFISEFFMTKYKVPRPLIFAFAYFLTCIGQLFIAYPSIGSVYVASLMVGFGFGVQAPVLMAIISELFGLKRFSTLFNWGQLVVPFGSYILNVEVVGKLYDLEASKLMHRGKDNEIICLGPTCFGNSFKILAAVTLFGGFIMLLLAYRTREFYRGDDYNNKYKEDLWIEPSQMEFYHLANKSDRECIY